MNGQQRLEELQQQLQKAGSHLLMPSQWLAEKWAGPQAAEQVISTGCAGLDAWFPHGGMVRGQTIEIVSPTGGAGATYVAMILARQICGPQGLLVLIDRNQDFNPAILLTLGFDLDHVLVVQPQSEEDHLWALEQALADSCVAAVWTRIEKIDKRYQRRWQLAAERGQTIGILQRPEKVLGQPTWATIQFEVRSNPHSHWLIGNRRASSANNPSLGDDLDGSAPAEAAEHWIVQLVARRSAGRFEATALQIELHNRSWNEWHGARDSRVTPDAKEWFFSQRLPHPNDPWFTKATSSESEQGSQESADTGSPSPYRATGDGPPSQRRRS